jgi:hypothetical protein
MVELAPTDAACLRRARLIQLAANATSCGTPRPCSSIQPISHCASALPRAAARSSASSRATSSSCCASAAAEPSAGALREESGVRSVAPGEHSCARSGKLRVDHGACACSVAVSGAAPENALQTAECGAWASALWGALEENALESTLPAPLRELRPAAGEEGAYAAAPAAGEEGAYAAAPAAPPPKVSSSYSRSTRNGASARGAPPASSACAAASSMRPALRACVHLRGAAPAHASPHGRGSTREAPAAPSRSKSSEVWALLGELQRHSSGDGGRRRWLGATAAPRRPQAGLPCGLAAGDERVEAPSLVGALDVGLRNAPVLLTGSSALTRAGCGEVPGVATGAAAQCCALVTMTVASLSPGADGAESPTVAPGAAASGAARNCSSSLGTSCRCCAAWDHRTRATAEAGSCCASSEHKTGHGALCGIRAQVLGRNVVQMGRALGHHCVLRARSTQQWCRTVSEQRSTASGSPEPWRFSCGC